MQADQRILQMSWVVRDLEEAALRWHRTTGIGPFIINRHIPITGGVHRGRPQKTDFSTAIAQAGPVQVELVQQHDDSPSCYRDLIAAGDEGMHHVAVIAEDYDAAVATYTAQGHEIASAGNFGEVRFSYIDTTQSIGHMVEILEDSRAIRAFFAMIVRAAEEWDGDTATLLREL